MAERVLITFEVDAKGAIKQVDNVKKVREIPAATQKADAGIKGLTASMAKIGGAAVIAGAAMKALRGSIRFMGDSIDASQVQERVFVQLEQSVKRVGASYEALEPILGRHFARIQKNTRFGDDASAKALQQLTDTVGSVKLAFQLLEPTMDLAVAKDIELATAVKLVGVAAMGQVGTLSRYGLILDDNQKKILATAGAAERTALVAGLLNEKFGGAAQADMKTYGGQVEGVANAFGDLQEEVGDLFTNMATSTGALTTVVELLQDATTAVNYFEIGLQSVRQIGAELNLLTVEAEIQSLGAAIAELDNTGRDKLPWYKGGQERSELVSQLTAMIEKQEQLTGVIGHTGTRVTELTDRVNGNTDAANGNANAWDQTGGSINDAGKAVAKVSKDFGNAIQGGLLFAKTIRDGKSSVDLFENSTVDLSKSIGFELTPVTAAAIAKIIELNRASKDSIKPLKKMAEETNKIAETMEKTFSDLLTSGLAGELESFGDLWRTIWGNLAMDAVGMIGDAFSEALDDGGTIGGVGARFADNFWSNLTEGGTGAQLGGALSGVGGVMNAAQGPGGAMGFLSGAASGAMAGAAISAMITGATIGSAFPVVGTIIGAAIGGIIGLFGSGGGQKKPRSHGSVSFTGGTSYLTTSDNQNVSWSQEQAWMNERIIQYRGQVQMMNEILRLFSDSTLFDMIGTGMERWAFDERSGLDTLTTLFTEQVLPEAMRAMFEGALNQGFTNMGVSDSAISRIWGEIDIMDVGEQTEALRNYVGALVGTARMIEEMDWNAILDDVNANSMEQFAAGFNQMMTQLRTQMLGLDDMTFQERADMALAVNDLVLQARQAEIQMLTQINQIQQSINDSIDDFLEESVLGGMDPTGQSQYYLDNIVDIMDQLNAGVSSPEELATLMADLLRYAGAYRGVMGENFYQPGEDGIIPNDWLTSVLEAARTMSDDMAQDFRDGIEELNQAILDELILIYEALTTTTEERLGIEVDVNVTVTVGDGFLADVEAMINERWLREDETGGTS